jgi:hypothetical protein
MSRVVLLEVVAGWLGFLGVGHIVSRRVVRGVLLMASWWLGVLLGLTMVWATGGLGIVCFVPIWLLGPIFSASSLRDQL